MKKLLAVNLLLILLMALQAACGNKDKTSEPDPQPPAPTISRFTPAADTIGATVIIYGAHFHADKSKNTVTFNGVSATVLSASADSLATKVPANTTTGKIKVVIGTRSVETATDFTVLYSPAITSFSPAGDTVGATVTIKGRNFGKTIDKNIVTFPGPDGRVPATLVSASDTQLVAKVPPGAQTTGRINVQVDQYKASPANAFYILIPPTIISFAPFAGPVGTVIEIKGTNFTQFPDGLPVFRFNGVEAKEYDIYTNPMKVRVPEGATTGKITVSTGSATGISLTDFEVSSQQWKRKADLGKARYGAVHFTIGGKGYVGLGKEFNADSALRDLWEYDPVANVWTKKGDMPAPGKYGSSHFVLNGKAYIFSGSTSNGQNNYETWEYDPGNDKWTQMADFNHSYQSLPIAFGIGNIGYCGLGDSYYFYAFDPVANQWSRKADFSGPLRQGAASFVVGGKGYMSGGEFSYAGKKDLWEYDPANDTWTQKADYPGVGRYLGVGFSIGNLGYIGMGTTHALGPWLKDIWQYNPATNTWLRKLDFPYDGRETPAVLSINGKVYIGVGGTPYAYYRDLWEYTP